jgi:hypothetical protein
MRFPQICSFLPPLIRQAVSSTTMARLAVTLIVGLPQLTHAAPRGDGQLELEIVDAETGQPIAARVHLKSSRARSIKLQLPGTAEYGDHFYVDGRVALPLRVGQ